MTAVFDAVLGPDWTLEIAPLGVPTPSGAFLFSGYHILLNRNPSDLFILNKP